MAGAKVPAGPLPGLASVAVMGMGPGKRMAQAEGQRQGQAMVLWSDPGQGP